MTHDETGTECLLAVDPEVASKFKVLTCMSTACAEQRKRLGLDEYSTFSAFWIRILQRSPRVQLEESPCLGSCKKAPCVGIEHEDYEGRVSVEDMSPTEFSHRAFHNVVTDLDADRVWTAIENAILSMADESGSTSESDGFH